MGKTVIKININQLPDKSFIRGEKIFGRSGKVVGRFVGYGYKDTPQYCEPNSEIERAIKHNYLVEREVTIHGVPDQSN